MLAADYCLNSSINPSFIFTPRDPGRKNFYTETLEILHLLSDLHVRFTCSSTTSKILIKSLSFTLLHSSFPAQSAISKGKILKHTKK